MSIKVVIDPGCYKPTRAHDLDVGYDLYSPVDAVLPVCSYITDGSVEIDTGVHIQLPRNIRGKVASKSGLMFSHNIITDGTVDPGYTGSIKVKLFNLGNAAYRIEKGQKIAQLILEQVITPDLETVEELEETNRGTGGFGSTGKF